jgi:diguanylate cyclase
MQYDDSIEDSRQYLRLALELIGKFQLPTDPLNYCIWYEYASERNQALSAAINQHLESDQVFSQTDGLRLLTQYIAGIDEKLNDQIKDTLKKLFVDMIGAINTTNKSFNASENNLESINAALVPSLSEADVERIVSQIKEEIKALESSSASFKEQLSKATREIDQLKQKIARYRKEALKDPLTRIDNRRGFEQVLQQAIEQSASGNAPLCLIMTDIDHFKRINDTHGHLVGDNVLRMVASTIKDSIKGRDRAARVGGEEFAILLPATPLEGARKLAENLRITFERLDLKKKNTGESLGRITLSFGVTAFRPDDGTEEFVNRADKALYQSKKAGRNKVTGL